MGQSEGELASETRSAREPGFEDFWCVYDAHFDHIHAAIVAMAAEHPGYAPILRSMTPEDIAQSARDYRQRLQLAFDGDPSSRDAYLREIANAYAKAGIGFADWASIDSAFEDSLTPLLVAAYAHAPDRLSAALRAMRLFAQRTTAVIGTAYIETKESALRQAAEAIDLERQRLAAIVDALPVGVWISESDGRVTRTNAAAAEVFGGKAPRPARVEQYSEYVATWPETGKIVQSDEWPIVHTLRTGEPVTRRPMDIRGFDGSVGHVLFSSVPLPARDGERHGAMVVALDITDQQQSLREREKLVASLDFERQRLRALLQKAPSAILVTRGRDHVIELVNARYMEIVGQRCKVGQRIEDALPEIRAQGLLDIFDRVLETGEPFVGHSVPIKLVRTPGAPAETRFFDLVYQPIVEADGTITGIFVQGVDVTETVTAAARIRAQFKAMPVPAVAWRRLAREGRPDFVMKDYNDAAMTFTKGGIPKLIGMSASDFFGDDSDGIVALMNECLATGRSAQREHTHKLRSTGETKQVFVTYASVPPDTVLAHIEDITERTRLEEQLRSAQKMEAIGRLAGGVAHDFNNILSVILGYTALMAEELGANDPLRADLLEISTAAGRASALTKQLLAMGRQQVLQPRAIDLAESLHSLEKMLQRVLGDGIELSIDTSAERGAVSADPSQIDQVIMNLVVNARDAMAGGGTLTIELHNVTIDAADATTYGSLRPGPYMMMSFRDTGLGMDAVTKARIFEPFFTTKEAGKGTGLGLATVFGIVQQSGGHIQVESELGRGTTFQIYVPRIDDEPVPISNAAPVGRPATQKASETILLVEDDPQVRTLTATVLKRLGYKVLDAQNGGEALLICEQHTAPIQLLITDVVMPRMSGRELAERLAPMRPDMKVLFMSGYTDDAVVRHGVLASDLAFLQKPVTAAKLAHEVRRVLDETPASAGSTPT